MVSLCQTLLCLEVAFGQIEKKIIDFEILPQKMPMDNKYANMEEKLRILEDLNMMYIRQIALSLQVRCSTRKSSVGNVSIVSQPRTSHHITPHDPQSGFVLSSDFLSAFWVFHISCPGLKTMGWQGHSSQSEACETC